MQEQIASVGPDERTTLKELALAGGLDGPTPVTCADVADRLDASNQTASRRLQRLESVGLIDREIVGDGQRVALTEDGERVLRSEYEQYRQIFEQESIVAFDGRVTSGMGEGRHYISLPGYMEQFETKLGYEPFLGTLNVALDDDSVAARSQMDGFEPVRIDGWEGENRTYGPAFCWPATVETQGEQGDPEPFEPTHVIAPERTHHDADKLEIIAPVKLRDELALTDEQEVTVRVTAE